MEQFIAYAKKIHN